MRTLLVANLTTRQPASSISGAATVLPRLQAGQQWQVGLRFTEAEEGVFNEVRPAVRAVRASIGPIDARPTSGTFCLQVGVGLSTAGNTTTPLPYNATAVQMTAALNALSVGTFLATLESGSYLIRRLDGTVFTLTPRHNVLAPISAARVRGYFVDNGWVNEVRLVQAPYAFADNAAQVLADAPYVETVVDGYTDPSNTWYIDEVQDLIIGTSFRGTYRLLFDYGGGVAETGLPRRTAMLGVADGPEEVQEALNAIMKDLPGRYDGSVTVTNPSTNVARITFGGEALSGINLPPLRVEAFPSSGDLGDWTFTLDLNRAEMWSALRQQDDVVVPFEVEVDIYIDRSDLSQGFRTVKLWSVPVTLARPVLYEGLAQSQSIDWLRPISPRSYIAFSPDQIITGQQHWVGTVTVGTAAVGEQEYTIDHNFNTEAVHVTVRQNVTPGNIIIPSRVTVDSPNSITLGFLPPLSGVYAVLITSAGPTSVFQAHTHTTAQVTGLEELIGGLALRVTALERLLPRSGAQPASVVEKPINFDLPVVAEILPDINVLDAVANVASQVIAGVGGGSPPPPPRGTEAEAEQTREKEEEAAEKADPDKVPPNVVVRAIIPGIGDTAKAGRPAVGTAPEVPPEPAAPLLFPPARGTRLPVLLQAVPAAELFNTTELPVGTALVDGRVYRYTGTQEFFVPGDNGRPTLPLPTQGLFAYKQGNYYRVRDEGGAVYYPYEFDRELWRVHISADQLVSGATLRVSGELRFRLIGEFFDAVIQKRGSVDLAAQYTLFCEALELQEGASLGSVVRTTTLATTRLIFSPVLKAFNWRLVIGREADVLTSSFSAFSKTTSSTGFAAPFILRLRLGAFDIDDLAAELPRGQIALIMPSTKLEVSL